MSATFKRTGFATSSQPDPTPWWSKRETMKKTILALLSILLVTFSGMNNRLQAQSGNAVVDGVIEDPSGAVVPGCDVKLVNIATGGVLTTQSNGAGLYVFPSVKA